MSKIYEALQRAEQERGTYEQERVVPQDRTPASIGDDKAGDHQPLSSHVVSSISGANALTSEALTPTLEWAKEEVWTPDVSSLRGLLSRGKQVEQLRGLRSRLLEIRAKSPVKSILISSALPGEGKSYVAVNLAITLSLHKNSRVLLIDGDLRRSTQHLLLGATNVPGLAEYLEGKATPEQILHRGRAPERATNWPQPLSSLTFIPAGKAGEQAGDLSAHPRFSELLTKLSPLFDWIVVDSSPVTLVADGANMARACDGVLFIARGGATKYQAAQKALIELKASNVLGVVLNASTEPNESGSYYGYNA